MEKKSLGRGLEDISDIFLTPKKEDVQYNDSTAEYMRDRFGKTHREHSFEGSKAKMSFSENDIITMLDGRLKLNRSGLAAEHPLENDLSKKDNDPLATNMKNSPDDCRNLCEITEHVTSNKKMGFLSTPDVQQNIVKTLFQYLRQNFNIRKIELVKCDEVSRPGMKNLTEENILIYIKDEENY